MKLKQLIDERKGFVAKIDALLALADKEKRDLSTEENTEFDTLTNSVLELDGKIETARRVDEMHNRSNALESHLQTVPGPRIENDPSGLHLSANDKRDLKSFSFVKAIRESINGQPLTGVEKEMHQQACLDAKAAGVDVNGLGIPQMVLAHGGASRFRADLTAETSTEGVETVQTDVRALIDILHEKLMVRQMGATFLSDLVGNVSFPRPVLGTDPAHKDENAAADETSPTFGTVTLSPERLPVYAEVSKQLLRQSSASIESWLRSYIATRIAVIMDKMAINGSGSSHQPTGILATSGIGSVETDSTSNKADKPTYADIVDLETEVAVDNADDGALGYLTTPVQRGVLKQTEEFATTNGRPVWTGSRENGEMNGYPARASNVVPSDLTKLSVTALSAIIFGNWSELLIGQWGGLDIMANPFIKDIEGLVRITADTYYDVAVRHPQSFAAILDANTVDMA